MPRSTLPFALAVAAAAVFMVPARAQQDRQQPVPADAPALPAAGSAEARAQVDRALDKLVAYARGTFRSSERQVLSQRGLRVPIPQFETVVVGGWHRELTWAEHGQLRWMRAHGRSIVPVDGTWQVRRDLLGDGGFAPFLFDVDLFCDVLRDLPAATARTVVHVAPAEAVGRPAATFTLRLEHAHARALIDSGALPSTSSMGLTVQFPGGVRDVFEPPPCTTWLALCVAIDDGDLLWLESRTIEQDEELMGRGAGAPAGGVGGGQNGDAAPVGGLRFRHGLPAEPPPEECSTTSFRVDFGDLGRVARPKLDERAAQLLRVRR